MEIIEILVFLLDYLIRDIAQLGRAPALGAGCRRFKSYYPDTSNFIKHTFLKKLSQEAKEVLIELNFFFIIFNYNSELLIDHNFVLLCIINLILIQNY